MLDLWEALSVELGSAFTRQFGSPKEAVFEHWLNELWDFSREDIAHGLRSFKDKGSTFISLNVFRNHCKPSGAALGLPALDQALRLVTIRAWEDLHPAFQKIAQERVVVVEEFNGAKRKVEKLRFNLSQLKYEKDSRSARDLFKPFYEEVVRRVREGEEFERIKMISSETSTPSGTITNNSRKKGRAVLSELLGEMRGRA